METAPTVRAGVLLATLYFAVGAGASLAQMNTSVEQSLAAARVALRKKHYIQAINLLESGLRHFPDDERLRVELGRAYLYDHQDERAMRLFRDVLRKDPSNRPAKLELARALGYHRDYDASDRLYRELLKASADDEAASVGLIRNLMYRERTAEARQELNQALARHPNSALLEKYKAELEKRRASLGEERPRPRNRVQGGGDYFSDSAGNRAWRGIQHFNYNLGRRVQNRVRLEERSLWRTAGPKANVLSGTEELRVRLLPALVIGAGGGSVRFADGGSRGLYRGDLEFHPSRQLWWDVAFSRDAVAPTFLSTQFKLLVEGWQSRLDWRPKDWDLNVNFSRQHYSDGNRRQREGGEVLRWLGGSRLAFGTGYRITYFSFSDHFLHGYFNPREYLKQLSVAGMRFRLGKAFRADYLGRVGAESFSPGATTVRDPYRLAWEVALRNRVVVRHWEVGGDYYYWNLAQVTGAFRAQAVSFAVAYNF